MSKLSTQGSNQNKPFKPKIYQGRNRGQGRYNYYDRGRQQDRFRLSSSDRYRRLNHRDKPLYVQNFKERSQYGQICSRGNFRTGTIEEHKIIEEKL